METLSSAELYLIRSMLVKEYGSRTPFLDQLALASVENRRKSGVGVFVNLLVAEGVASIDELNTEISEGCRTRFPAPCDLVGFTLFIRKGYLNFLEGYTFGDVAWPTGPMEDWLIFETANAGSV